MALHILELGVFEPTRHGVVLLLQCGGVYNSPEEAPVADGVLLPLIALIQQLVVQQEQLAAQCVELVQGRRAWGDSGKSPVIKTRDTHTHAHARTHAHTRLKSQR